MSDEPETCGVEAEHPELGTLACAREPGHEPPHRVADPAGEGAVEWFDDVDGDEPSGAVFDVEAFVKALPDGVVLCPLCIGAGGVVEEPPFDPHTHRCTTCDGRGKVRTGSLVSSQAERDCVDCNGNGWLSNDPNAAPAAPARASDFADDVVPTDHQGRTPDDPEFDWSRVTRAPAPAPEPERV